MARASSPAKGIAAAAAKIVTETVAAAVVEKVADAIQGDTSAATAPALAGGPTSTSAPILDAGAIAQAGAELIAADAAVNVTHAFGLDAPTIRVTATQPERRRAGFKFTSIAETISAALVGIEQLHALVSDPVLRVEVSVDGVEFKVMSRDDLPPLPLATDDD